MEKDWVQNIVQNFANFVIFFLVLLREYSGVCNIIVFSPNQTAASKKSLTSSCFLMLVFLAVWVDKPGLSKKFFGDIFSYLAYGKRMAAICAAHMFTQTFAFLEVCIEL